ncbi:gp658 [Bacillus phage G]|uniref:Gp658 n=1 Tax=Bacillus phage G TaxID=2884420 RepID=G3MB38_9CAUD|nr:gp658 [Bacillus phage G]AEO93901.1 gp658 [Bacillus phage G]
MNSLLINAWDQTKQEEKQTKKASKDYKYYCFLSSKVTGVEQQHLFFNNPNELDFDLDTKEYIMEYCQEINKEAMFMNKKQIKEMLCSMNFKEVTFQRNGNLRLVSNLIYENEETWENFGKQLEEVISILPPGYISGKFTTVEKDIYCGANISLYI